MTEDRRDWEAVRFCVACDECVGGVLAVLALKVCPGCRERIIPVEDRTVTRRLYPAERPERA